MAYGILALNYESYLALKLALDSRVLALVLVSRVQALALKGPGLGLGLEGPGLDGPGLGLALGLWILALTTTLQVTELLWDLVLYSKGVNVNIKQISRID